MQLAADMGVKDGPSRVEFSPLKQEHPDTAGRIQDLHRHGFSKQVGPHKEQYEVVDAWRRRTKSWYEASCSNAL